MSFNNGSSEMLFELQTNNSQRCDVDRPEFILAQSFTLYMSIGTYFSNRR
ncbi:hypothetical protein DFR28_102168 [Arenicella xantha]|uniref:Uncharacterized protein n=1 Tax=Arenicella xantha TaxID=644221 RepID=A0A395JIZ6_9GAMM|nr:hypothetical protein DFR28_102168 [Arenicella xantha]